MRRISKSKRYNTSMNFDAIGLHPDNAIGIVLKLYDEQHDTPAKVSLLLNNRPFEKLPSKATDERFKSGMTIDINAGELMGIGCVATYYNWCGEAQSNTYQAMVGVEDSVKAQSENILSDGAVWHDQSKKKMLYQLVLVQGYYPKQTVNTDHVISQINLKTTDVVRAGYPENCGLIVNVFSEAGEIDLARVTKESNFSKYTEVLVVIYQLPSLQMANVYKVSKQRQPSLTIGLERHQMDEQWEFNYSDSKRNIKGAKP